MNMKRHIITLAAVSMLLPLMARELLKTIPGKTKEELNAMSSEEFFAYVDELNARNAPPTGGSVYRQVEGRIIAVRNRQTKFSPAEIEAAVALFRDQTYWPVFVVADGDTSREIGAELVLCDDIKDRKATLLTAPEQSYAELATAWLLADSPKPGVRTRRLNVEVYRAISSALGLGIAAFQPSVMSHVHSLKDLDRLGVRAFGPEILGILDEECAKLGIKKVYRVTYRKACQEGWAPAPTNDVQRKIWKEVHELPSAPITIEKK